MNSIRRQLTLWLLLGGTLLLGGAGAVTYYLMRHALLVEVDSRLRVEVLAVVKQTKQEPEDIEELKSADTTNIIRPELEVSFTDKYMPEFEKGGSEFFQLWDANGKTIKRSDSLGKSDLPVNFGSIERPAYWNLTLPNGRTARAVGIRFVPPSAEKHRKYHDPNFHATAVVAGELGQAGRALDSLRGVLLSVGGMALAATLLVMPLVLRRSLAPVNSVAEHAARLEVRNLHSPFPVGEMPAELRPICVRLNELLARLEQSFAREQRFSADVAHELRTPIAELRSLAEVNLKWPEDEASRTKSFHDAFAIARQMEGVVTSLLVIARCEADKQSLSAATIPLAAFVAELWQPFAAKALAKQLAVDVNVPDNVHLQTDRALLAQILTNLFSNAADYTPNRGAIVVNWNSQPSGWALSVTNTTLNLARADLPKLFERFWRKDTARSSSEHSGLGLALAKASANALGFALEASLQQENTLTITLAGSEARSC